MKNPRRPSSSPREAAGRAESPERSGGEPGWGAAPPTSGNRSDPRTPRARKLRHETTPAERKLWRQLRQVEWPGGHFRRQAPIGPYYADFAHHGLKLVVELDGGQHSEDAAVRYDAARSAYLEGQGYRVIRFWNGDVYENLDGVVETILSAAAERPPTPVRAARDSALPAAPRGEGSRGPTRPT